MTQLHETSTERQSMKKTSPKISQSTLRALSLCTVLSAVTLLQACIPLAITAVGAGVLVASDRRSTATQAVDQEIGFKAGSAIRSNMNDQVHINITSYNRMVLLTGEVATEAEKKQAEELVGKIVNVRSVVNELQIGAATGIKSRSNDVFINGKIKASFVDAKDIFANSFKIVVENSDVFLLGVVTEREANRAAEIASRVVGVNKVVKVMEIISEDDLKRMGADPGDTTPQPANKPPAK
jgi:osmotically-inducible protein OsmY